LWEGQSHAQAQPYSTAGALDRAEVGAGLCRILGHAAANTPMTTCTTFGLRRSAGRAF